MALQTMNVDDDAVGFTRQVRVQRELGAIRGSKILD
jgi:hypothetical protein